MQSLRGNQEEERRKRREFGRRLRLARERAGLTQSQLAEQLGVRQPYISQIERGTLNLTMSTIAALAQAVGCTYSILLTPASQETGRNCPAAVIRSGARGAISVARVPEGDVRGAVFGRLFELDEAAAQPALAKFRCRNLEAQIGLAA